MTCHTHCTPTAGLARIAISHAIEDMSHAVNSMSLVKISTPAPGHRERPQAQKRGQWSNKIEFFLSVAGEIIGLGNVWRFPYLCYRNGGGAFFIPYILFFVFCGMPLFFLEAALGQFTSEGGITCWRRICPIFEGIGYATQVIMAQLSVYYIVILAWAIFYLCHSFSSELPWSSCNNTWNTVTCVEFKVSDTGESLYNLTGLHATSPIVEFWERRVLRLSKGIEYLGTVHWDLALCLLGAWVICYFCIWKGTKSTGKVVYVTATFPYIMLVVLTIRGVTLPGAADGLRFYLYPDISRLKDPQVWMDAGTQILFSYAVCLGCITTLSSYNNFNNDCFKDCVLLCCLNSATSFLAGFAIFSVLGFMALEQNVPISKVAVAGPGLAFIAYPKAVSMMPLAPLWASLFFIMLLFLGLDSQFVCVETFVTSIMDMFPSTLHIGHRRELLILACVVVYYLCGLFLITDGGMYVFILLDTYAASGLNLFFVAVFECICIGWAYGGDRFYDNIQQMIGYRPMPLFKLCWKYFTPGICIGIFLFSIIKYKPPQYKTYIYPTWGYVMGWFIALSSNACILLWMLYAVLTTKGSLQERLTILTSSSLLQPNPKALTNGDLPEMETLAVTT